MRPSALISCASFQNEAQRGPRVASEASDSGPWSWRASPPAEGSGRTDDSLQFTISSHRHTADLAAVMPLAYNIVLLIYVRFIGRLAKLPIILRLALCDRRLWSLSAYRVLLYECCIALARVGAAGQCVHWNTETPCDLWAPLCAFHYA